MKSFNYVIKDQFGFHARPAGAFVKEAEKYNSTVKVSNGKKEVDGKKIIGLMSLGVKEGETVTITTEGPDEVMAQKGLEQFLKENL